MQLLQGKQHVRASHDYLRKLQLLQYKRMYLIKRGATHNNRDLSWVY